ncbi:12421_t:CDS:2 [Funneliformis geosporum]|uniref:12421_t:CDS:1 n=1 Tax=Funneliformis geosporum TaxID=1117311 RepID=A0A9W4SRL5_9GLOM|nr:12421_t:CDS:2 [Funneliformis geosporum]
MAKNFRKLTWDNKKKLAFQIADGLNYLHNENILHSSNNAKITDFGISKNMNAQNSSIHIGIFGRNPYIDPKILIDLKFQHIKASDIYSFGVVMLEISNGVSPFESLMSKGDQRIKITSGARETSIEGTPHCYEMLYKNCWDMTPENRPKIKNVLEKFKDMGFGVDCKKVSLSENSSPEDPSSID